MIDILYNKLLSSNDVSVSEWKDVDPLLFNKHSQHSQHSVKEYNDNTKEYTKEFTNTNTKNDIDKTQAIIEQQAISKVPILSKKKTNKDIIIKPLGIIINETMSFNNSTEYIKEKLITLISKEEFTKVFGITKCAEIMSGIVNNRWNKSTALFISFLLDKEVYYNDNIILYNKEKNKDRITI